MVDEISARGEVVLAELKLLVSLAAEPSNPHSETSIQQNGAAPARNHPTIMIKTPQQPPPKAAPVAFPRRRTQSITKLNKSPPSSKPKTDENVHPGKANLDIGRVKRKLSGGLSNILRPWPLVTKTQTQTPPERQPPSTSVDSEEKGGLRKIKRKVSSNLRAMRATASEEKPRPVKASSQQRSRAVMLAGEDCIKEREELISALVGEAMADTEVRDAVQARWVSVPSSAERIKIRYGEKLARFGPILEIPSKSLAALNVEVVEIREIRSAPELLTTDVPIFLTSSHVPSLVTRHPNTLLVQLSSTEPSENGKRVTSPPTSAALVINALNERLDAIENNRDSYRTEAPLSLLDECSFELRSASQDLEAARMNAHALEEQIDEYIAQLDTQLSEINVSQLVQENKRTLQTSFDKFKWYRIWDIDTVGDQISYHVATGYGVALERKLEWYAGLMAASQSRIRHLCADFMQMIPRSLDAATIQNDIERIQSTTPFVASSTFTGIVAHRRRQLMESVTNRMQARFLRRVYIAMAGMPIAAGAPAMLWANELLSSTYALPSGLLAILLCVRHVSAGWEKLEHTGGPNMTESILAWRMMSRHW
ncbi:SubName: Full=Uncharacterized protein {ECO:0000313/EMBL:CCA68666.1} [Serendipita indica DSM 11827]|nr:SubName: Full=Uncharacterized protein {ECO:0000313/EMBL:CCA68666.1} [Serendipita indica DSM 11827]